MKKYLDLNNRNVRYGVAALAVLLSLYYLYPAFTGGGGVDSKLEKARLDFEEISLAAERYEELSARSPAAPKGGGKFDFSLELGKAASGAGINNNVKKMVPRGAAGGKKGGEEMSVTISGVQLQSLVKFLQNLQRVPGGIAVKKGELKPSFEDRNLLDAELIISSLE